jgi:hypothetical protein
MIFTPSAVRHSFQVMTSAGPPASRDASAFFTHTIFPWPFASLQKSTAWIRLSDDLTFSSIPSGMTSPWQNQADFWWTWSLVALPGSFASIGQARVTGTPPGASTGHRYGLATDSATW